MASFSTATGEYVGDRQVQSIEVKGDQLVERQPSSAPQVYRTGHPDEVIIHGVSMKYDDAVKGGYLNESPAPQPVPHQSQQQSVHQPTPQQQQAGSDDQNIDNSNNNTDQDLDIATPIDHGNAMDESVVANIDGIEKTSPASVTHIVNALATGNGVESIPEQAIEELAGKLGVDRPVVMNGIESVYNAAGASFNHVMKQSGLDPTMAAEWAYENAPELMRQGLQDQFDSRGKSGWAPVVNAYIQNLDTADPQAILNADFGKGCH